MSDLTGQSLGPYTITERIGRGGMAEVYKALHTGLSVHRAVKVIRPEFVTADDFRARFQKEAQSVAQLRHPNIVQVHDFGTHGNAYYMVMEFIEGRDLKQILAAEGPIRPIARTVDLIERVASALEYAHGRGIIHRDIKPENVMVTAAGEPILTDFGIAKLATSSTQLTQTGFGIGTPAYMAPEQAQGATDLGPQADIYALTIVLFELLTGRVPFSADTPIAVIMKSISDPLPMPRTLSSDISEALQAVIVKGTQKRPEDRFATVAEFRRALSAAAREPAGPNETVAAATLVRASPASAVATPKRTGAWAIGAIAAVVAVIAAALWYLQPAGVPAIETPSTAVTAPAPSPAPEPTVTAEPSVESSLVLTLDKPVEAPAGASTVYTFDGAAGETLLFDRLDDSPAQFTLVAPNAMRILEATGDAGPFELSRTGTYRLTAAPGGETRAKFVLRRLDVPVIDGGELTINTIVEGRIDVPGQLVRYRVRLNAGQPIRLALDRTTAPTDFRLLDATGANTLFAAEGSTGLVRAPSSGDYVLTVDPRDDAVAQYAFALRTPPPRRQRQDLARRPVPPRVEPATTTNVVAPPVAAIRAPTAEPLGPSPASTTGNQLVKGVTTQRDLLRLFGGPNLTTVDKAGLETWIYERTVTQTDSSSSGGAVGGGVDFNVFFNVIRGGASASAERFNDTASTRSTIRNVTVIVTFAPNRTVSDYTVRESFF